MTTTGWRATERIRHELLALPPAARLAATIGLGTAPAAGEPVPPLWHWLYFLPADRHDELASDGHPRRGGFLPPVAHRRRMWGGGRLRLDRPLHFGEEATLTSTVTGVAEKQGRSGPLTVVTVAHEVAGPGGLAVAERQDLVYTDAPPMAPQPGGDVPAAPWQATVVPDEALLFRFSALTFNAHRIHYDRAYATAVEGYPALVVHGPLVALLLAELARRHGAALRAFEYRARAAFHCGRSIHLRGSPGGELAAYDDTGVLGMRASFT